MGRSCGCQSGYIWVEQWKWKDLLHKYEEWRAQIIDIDGQMTEKSPLPLQEERRYFGKKTLAQVCQEQLRARPFADIKNPDAEVASEDDEPIVDEYGNVRKANKKSKQWLSKHKSCHVCLHRHPKWKMAFCSDCDLAYCYGTLFRAHDTMPINVMENHHWKCPHCRRVCNTGACRRDPRQYPFEPRGTLLGHDTKKVADPRSVECLVDFSVSNLNWLREEEGMVQSAMQRRMEQAEREKEVDPSLDARYVDENHAYTRYGITYSPVEDLDGAVNDVGDGAQAGPSQAHQHYDNNGDYDEIGDEIPRLGQKRRRDDDDEDGSQRKKKKPQKRKDPTSQPPQPKNVPGKQYEKERQRKLLEDAKREDRSILVAARMKGKSKIVTLSLSAGRLDQIRNRPVPERSTAVRQRTPDEEKITGNLDSILQSDILPNPHTKKGLPDKEKEGKTFRVRIEEDEAYSTRKRNNDIGGPVRAGRPRGSQRFEELTLESDEELDNHDEEGETGNTARARGRASNWLARRHDGEEDTLTELPPNFKDGDLRTERERERNRIYAERRKTMPPKPKPPKPKVGIRPVGRPPNDRDIAVISDVDGEHEIDDQHDETFVLAQQAAAAALERQSKEEEAQERAAAAEREAQENLRAKMAFFHESDEEEELVDDFLGDLPSANSKDKAASTPPTPEPERMGPPPATNSLLARPEMAGKQIKAVSASHKQNGSTSKVTTTTTITIPTTGFTSINKALTPAQPRVGRPKTIDLSDSESDDNVPASAPPKESVARPLGRPSMVPTRGNGTFKRGRGRPRKSM